MYNLLKRPPRAAPNYVEDDRGPSPCTDCGLSWQDYRRVSRDHTTGEPS